MLTLKIPDMTCGHCAGAVTRAVQSVDGAAKIDIDMKTQTVSIDTGAENAAIMRALEAAGYRVAADSAR